MSRRRGGFSYSVRTALSLGEVSNIEGSSNEDRQFSKLKEAAVRSKELRRASVRQVQADCVHVASDLQDGAVKGLMALLKGSPALTGMDVVETINESVVSAVEMNARHAARRARLEEEAAGHLARFEAMNLNEREAARHDGDLELYAEDNLLIREALFLSRRK